jgi:hypothetical protein
MAARDERYGGAIFDDASIRLRDHLKAFHPREYVSLLRDGHSHRRR